jgi:hypothetical protein
MFDNRVLRKIFVPKRDEETGEWRKLRNEELYVLCCSHNIVGAYDTHSTLKPVPTFPR